MAALCGCGSIQVRPLATGELERPAYALSGPSLDGLRDEARRLCPSGADVLRAAQRTDAVHAPQLPPESWYGRWWLKTQLSLTPPTGDSQLVVLCQPVPGLASLAAATPVSTAKDPVVRPGRSDEPVSAASSATAAPMLAPIGEGALRPQPPGPGARRVEAATVAGRGVDLRSGMTAAMPAEAVTSTRFGPAPLVPGMTAPGRLRGQTPSGQAGIGDARAASDSSSVSSRLRPGKAASAPILTY